MHLFIVSRQHYDLYDYLSERLSGNGTVRVIADRRSRERRRRAAPAAAERRRAERRARPEIDEQLRVHSHAIVTLQSKTPPPAETHAPLRDTLEWVETVQHHVTAVRAVLYDHERLRREAETVKENNARLRPDNERLRVENERLRAEAEQARKELEHVDAQLARALAIVNDLLARMQRAPVPDAGGSSAAAT